MRVYSAIGVLGTINIFILFWLKIFNILPKDTSTQQAALFLLCVFYLWASLTIEEKERNKKND